MTPKRCISWVAVSSEDQAAPDRESIPDQRQLNREFIASLGRYYPGESGQLVEELEVVGTRTIIRYDEAIEAYPAYKRLDEMICARAFDLLICRKRDRLGRETALVTTIESLALRAGILVVARDSLPATLDAHHASQDEGRRIVSLLESHLAGAEVREFVRRSRVGRERRARDGRFTAAVPFGWLAKYDAAGKAVIEIDSHALAIIRFAVLDCFLYGNMSTRAIIRELNARGYRTPHGKTWGYSSMRNLFELVDRYAGVAEYNRRSKSGAAPVRGAGKWPPILTSDERDAIRAELARRRGGLSYNFERLFSRCAVCDRCGASIVVSKTHDNRRPNWRMITYRCSNRCTGSHITEATLRAALVAHLEWLKLPANRAAILADVPDRTAAIRKQQDGARAELDQLAEQRRRADHAYVVLGRMTDEGYGEIMETLGRQLHAAQERMTHLEASLKEAEDEQRVGERLEEAARDGESVLAGEAAKANAWIRARFRLHVDKNRVQRIDNL